MKKTTSIPGASLPAVDIIRCAVEGVSLASLTIPGMGCCEVRLSGECASLRRLYVTLEHRRKGVGSTLFDAAVDLAIACRKASLCWTVEKSNTAAVLFYHYNGGSVFADTGDEYWMAVQSVNGQRELLERYTFDPEKEV
jgi:GNAT superfamily N-acetyltransferase